MWFLFFVEFREGGGVTLRYFMEVFTDHSNVVLKNSFIKKFSKIKKKNIGEEKYSYFDILFDFLMKKNYSKTSHKMYIVKYKV